ncbi:hypothetical protein Syun_028633 [Stephania yunnanensis]|uniref:Uncharacterized protein n=1 Tax=Stephania yunnanensis TaxID=152371 RepID=A0AAP0E468_9MAGN
MEHEKILDRCHEYNTDKGRVGLRFDNAINGKDVSARLGACFGDRTGRGRKVRSAHQTKKRPHEEEVNLPKSGRLPVIMCEIIIDNGSRSISRMFHRRRPIVEGVRAPLTMDGCSP